MLMGTGLSAWGPISCQLDLAAMKGALLASSCEDEPPEELGASGCLAGPVPEGGLLDVFCPLEDDDG